MQDNYEIRKTKRNFSIVGVILLIGLVIFGIRIATDPEDNLTLSKTAIVTDNNGNRFINGLLTNNVDRSYTSVEIHISLLDKNGQHIETAKATTDILPGGKTWEFKIPLQNQKVRDIKINAISTAEEELRND